MSFSTETDIYDDVPLSLLLKMESLSDEKLAAEKSANQLREENERLKFELEAKERDRKLFFDLYQNVVQFVPQLALQYCHFETAVTEEFYQQKFQNIQPQNEPEYRPVTEGTDNQSHENQAETNPAPSMKNSDDLEFILITPKETFMQKKRPIAKARKRLHCIQPKYFKCKSADGTSELEVTIVTPLPGTLNSK